MNSTYYQQIQDEDVLRNIRTCIENMSFLQDANAKIQLYNAYETISNYEGDDREYFVELLYMNQQAVLRGLLFMPNGMLFLDWESTMYLTRYVTQGYLNSTNSLRIEGTIKIH